MNSAFVDFNVNYAPKFTTDSKDVVGNHGEQISLECLVDSNPSASYSWFKNNQNVGNGSLMTFALTNDTAGLYTCQVGVPGFSAVNQSSQVQVRGAPVLQMDYEMHSKDSGLRARVWCEAESLPPARSFTWFLSRKLLEENSSDYSIIKTQHNSKVRSTVIISNMKEKYFGRFECIAENDIGRSSA